MKLNKGQIVTVKNGRRYVAIEDSEESETTVKARKLEGFDSHSLMNEIEYDVRKNLIRKVEEPNLDLSVELGFLTLSNDVEDSEPETGEEDETE